MSNFKKILSIGAVSSVALLGLGVSSGASTAQVPSAPSHVIYQSHAVTVTKVTFKGSYRGTIAMLFDSNTVTATSVAGRGSGTYLGASSLSGRGSGAATNYCDPFSGRGTLTGGGSKLVLSVVSSSQSHACVPSGTQAAPATVSVSGVAKVTSGTGKFRGVSGTLSFKGSFSVKNNAAGSSESDAFSATLTGKLTIRR